jgi:hypothetical protein
LQAARSLARRFNRLISHDTYLTVPTRGNQMTRYIASISQNQSLNSKNPFAWDITVNTEGWDDWGDLSWSGPVGRWIPHGPVHNNRRTDYGCFESKSDALMAILDYIAIPCVIRNTEFNGYEHLVVCPHGNKKARGRVIASRSAKGTFLAA